MKRASIPWLIVLGFVSASSPVLAQDKNLSEPPYLAHSANFMMVLFQLKANDVQVLLPEGVLPNANEAGMVTAGFEIYETDRVYGLPEYGMAFIFVEVKNLTSNNGTPGHWALWGTVDDHVTLQVMRDTFGFPYRFENVRVTESADIYTGRVGEEGKESVIIRIKFNEAKPFSGEGIVNMCSMAKNGKTLKTEVPWFTTGTAGDIIDFEIKPKGDKVLELIKVAKPHFQIISSNQIFSYSRPVVVNDTVNVLPLTNEHDH